MKNLYLLLGLVLVANLSFGAPREINIKAEMLDTKEGKKATHWSPQIVEVAPGEKVKFKVTHDLTTGFDFHGFHIPILKISETVNRNKPIEVLATIPADLKGEHPIGCQFHSTHVGAKLVVKPPQPKQ